MVPKIVKLQGDAGLVVSTARVEATMDVAAEDADYVFESILQLLDNRVQGADRMVSAIRSREEPSCLVESRMRPLLAVKLFQHDDLSKGEPGYASLKSLLQSWQKARKSREGLTLSARMAALSRPWAPDNAAADGVRTVMWVSTKDQMCWLRDMNNPGSMCLRRVIAYPYPDEAVLLGFVPVTSEDEPECRPVPRRSINAAKDDISDLRGMTPPDAVVTHVPVGRSADSMLSIDVSKLLARDGAAATFVSISEAETWLMQNGICPMDADNEDTTSITRTLRSNVDKAISKLGSGSREPRKPDPYSPSVALKNWSDVFGEVSEWIKTALVDLKEDKSESIKEDTVTDDTELKGPEGLLDDVMDLYRLPAAVGALHNVAPRLSSPWIVPDPDKDPRVARCGAGVPWTYRFGGDGVWKLELQKAPWDKGAARDAFTNSVRTEAGEARSEFLREGLDGAVRALQQAALLESHQRQDTRWRPGVVREVTWDCHRAIDHDVRMSSSYVEWDVQGANALNTRQSWTEGAASAMLTDDVDIINATLSVDELIENVSAAMGVQLTERGTEWLRDNVMFYNDDVDVRRSVAAQERRLQAAQRAAESQATWRTLTPETQAALREKTALRIEQIRESMMADHNVKSKCVATTLIYLSTLLGLTEHVQMPDGDHWIYALKKSELVSVQAKLSEYLSDLEGSTPRLVNVVKDVWNTVMLDKPDVRDGWTAAPDERKADSGCQDNPRRETSYVYLPKSSVPTAPTLFVSSSNGQLSPESWHQDESSTIGGDTHIIAVKVGKRVEIPSNEKKEDRHDSDVNDVVNLLLQLGVGRARVWEEAQSGASREVMSDFALRDVLASVASVAYDPPNAGVRSRVLESLDRLKDNRSRKVVVERCRTIVESYVAGREESTPSADWRSIAYDVMKQILGDSAVDRNMQVQFANYFVDSFIRRHNIQVVEGDVLKASKAAARRMRDDAEYVKLESMNAEVRAKVLSLKKKGAVDWRSLVDELVMEADAGDDEAVVDEHGLDTSEYVLENEDDEPSDLSVADDEVDDDSDKPADQAG